MSRPSTSAMETRKASSNSPVSCVWSAPAGPSSGPVLSSGFVLGTGLVGKLREVQTVHEVAEDGEAFFVADGSLALVLVAVDLIRLGNDAGGVHDLGRDEDGALRSHRERDRVRRPRVEVEIATVLLDIKTRVEDLVGEPRDDDALDADPKVAEGCRHQVVRQRTAQRVARDLGRDGLRLERADPDRQVPVRFLL